MGNVGKNVGAGAAKIVEMPKLSPTMEEGILSVWHKNEGDTLDVDDLIAEVETDKATMEFRSFDRGTLLKRLVSAGSTVRLGQPVAIIGNPSDDISDLLATMGPSPSPQPSPVRRGGESAQIPDHTVVSATLPAISEPGSPITEAPVGVRVPFTDERMLMRTEYEPDWASAPRVGTVLASPYVRKLARDYSVNLHEALGTGEHGRILPRDVETLKHHRMTPTSPRLSAELATTSHAPMELRQPTVRPLSMMRKTIARRLSESKRDVPHFYLTIEADVDELTRFRETLNRELSAESTHEGEGPGVKVSINDLLIKACAIALRRVPECNASFSPEGILMHTRVDISVAVAIPDGLVTPVIRNADEKSVLAIAREVRELADRGRKKKLALDEMQQGTLSISNLGMFGIDEFSAVINQPEGAILAVGRVREVAVVRDGKVEAGKRMSMTLSCDHRVIDGAIGAAFLSEVRTLLARPMTIVAG